MANQLSRGIKLFLLTSYMSADSSHNVNAWSLPISPLSSSCKSNMDTSDRVVVTSCFAILVLFFKRLELFFFNCMDNHRWSCFLNGTHEHNIDYIHELRQKNATFAKYVLAILAIMWCFRNLIMLHQFYLDLEVCDQLVVKAGASPSQLWVQYSYYVPCSTMNATLFLLKYLACLERAVHPLFFKFIVRYKLQV